MSVGVPMADCTSGLPATHIAMIATTAKNTTAVASHQRRLRYATTGNDTVQNLTNVPLSGACAPVTAERARATRLESRPTSSESDPIVLADRSIDRCVDTRW
jgi:hypothetical protein